MTRPLRPPEPPHDAGDPAARDILVMSRILMAGMLAVALIWPTEAATGTLTPWNRWFYPALFGLLAGGLWVLRRRPQQAALAYLAITLGVNLFLVSSLLLALFTHANQTRYSPVLAATAWMPLGYAGAFMFLHRRVALAMSVVTFIATFVPIAVGLLGGWLSHWSSDFPPLVLNMALAHAIYVLVQYGIGGMRMRYLRARERVKVMHELATTDMLTGLPNRREMNRVLNAQLGLARRGSLQLTVILIDVDHFKQINDRHGHAAGDAALVQLGQLLVSGLRDSDRLGRWGGEEFLLITPGVTLPGAVELAERLRSAVAGFAFAHPSPVTLSLGVLPGRRHREQPAAPRRHRPLPRQAGRPQPGDVRSGRSQRARRGAQRPARLSGGKPPAAECAVQATRMVAGVPGAPMPPWTPCRPSTSRTARQ